MVAEYRQCVTVSIALVACAHVATGATAGHHGRGIVCRWLRWRPPARRVPSRTENNEPVSVRAGVLPAGPADAALARGENAGGTACRCWSKRCAARAGCARTWGRLPRSYPASTAAWKMGFFDAFGKLRLFSPRAKIRSPKATRDPKAETTGAPAATLKPAGLRNPARIELVIMAWGLLWRREGAASAGSKGGAYVKR